MKLHQIKTVRFARHGFFVTPVCRAVLLAGLCASGAQSVAFANTERDLDSHEHGAANINLVIDGGTVFLELESPWNNLVGFEHSPSTESQHAAVDAAMETLFDPSSLFAFNDGAGCQAGSATIESTLDAEDSHDHDDHKDGEHDDHDDHKDGEHDDHDDHKDGEHDDHDDHADHDEHGDEETHSEVLAMYEFNCENPDKLESVEVKLFDLFDGFSDIDYQAAGPSGQAGDELSSSNTVVDLSGVR